MIRDRIVCKICGGWKDIDPATGEAMSCDTCDDVADEQRSEEHTSELQSQSNLVCRLLLEKKKHATRPPGSLAPVPDAAVNGPPRTRTCIASYVAIPNSPPSGHAPATSDTSTARVLRPRPL